MPWTKINVKPEQKEELDKIVEEEGRHLYKVIEILIENYKKRKEEKDGF